MAPKALGSEDLAVLEAWKGNKNPSHQQTAHMSATIREAINSRDAAKIYGGWLIEDYRRNKIQPRKEAIDCIEAAQKYGGVLVRNKTQPLRTQAYY